MKELLPPAASPLVSPSIVLLDRDQGLLAFNERVLDRAKRPEVPLLERLRYLCIVSSNLDELFEVRANMHLTAFKKKLPVRRLAHLVID